MKPSGKGGLPLVTIVTDRNTPARHSGQSRSTGSTIRVPPEEDRSNAMASTLDRPSWRGAEPEDYGAEKPCSK
jgi:hypothetical protein